VSIYQLVWMIVITGMPLLRLIELYLKIEIGGNGFEYVHVQDMVAENRAMFIQHNKKSNSTNSTIGPVGASSCLDLWIYVPTSHLIGSCRLDVVGVSPYSAFMPFVLVVFRFQLLVPLGTRDRVTK
jgi:hypothetical protein